MVSSYDFFPTILDYLEIAAPAQDRRRIGRSYKEFLQGRSPTWRTRLYFEYAYVRALRTANLKYVERAGGWPSELYDLEADPGEARNILNHPLYADQLRQLRLELSSYFKQMGAPPIEQWRTTTSQVLPKEDFSRTPPSLQP